MNNRLKFQNGLLNLILYQVTKDLNSESFKDFDFSKRCEQSIGNDAIVTNCVENRLTNDD